MDSRLADSTDRQQITAGIEVQRQQLFKASAIIDMCRYACASKLEGFDLDQLAMALHAIGDLISDTAEALELLAADETRQDCGQRLNAPSGDGHRTMTIDPAPRC